VKPARIQLGSSAFDLSIPRRTCRRADYGMGFISSGFRPLVRRNAWRGQVGGGFSSGIRWCVSKCAEPSADLLSDYDFEQGFRVALRKPAEHGFMGPQED
jgi:hypothetical protein